MTRAIAPATMPAVPGRYQGWRRSLRRGAMFHLIDYLGVTPCRRRALERNASRAPDNLGDMQYWGACPRCIKISERPDQ